MNTKKLRRLACSAFLVLSLIFVGIPIYAGAAEVINVKMGHVYKKGNIWAEHNQIFGDVVEKVTNGRVKFKHYWGGTLYSTYDEGEKLVISGEMPFHHTNTSIQSKYDPRWNAVFAPGVIWGWEHYKAVEKTAAYQSMLKYLEEKVGLKILYWIPIPIGDCPFTKKRAIVTLDDWKGLKIRTSPAEAAVLSVKALGGSPIILGTPETATAITQGVVDGGIATFAVVVHAWSAPRTVPYVTIMHGGVSLGFMNVGIQVNLKFWNSLSSDLREAIESGIPEAQAKSITWTEQEGQKLFDQYKNTPGTKITYLTKEQTKVWVDVLEQKALPEMRKKYGSELFEVAKATRPK